MNDEQQREQQFLAALTALTRKYGVSIGGCGCCDSPWLDTTTDVSDQRAGYSMHSGELRWIAPSDSYDWEHYSVGIVHDGSNEPRRILTCVYCGHQYPQDTPAHGSQVLTDHIKVCERHPMRKAEADIALLRSALAGLIGADTEDELRQMEAAMRILPAPDADKAVSINAIHVLLTTIAPNV